MDTCNQVSQYLQRTCSLSFERLSSRCVRRESKAKVVVADVPQSFFPTLLIFPLGYFWGVVDRALRWYQVRVCGQ